LPESRSECEGLGILSGTLCNHPTADVLVQGALSGHDDGSCDTASNLGRYGTQEIGDECQTLCELIGSASQDETRSNDLDDGVSAAAANLQLAEDVGQNHSGREVHKTLAASEVLRYSSKTTGRWCGLEDCGERRVVAEDVGRREAVE